MEDSHQFPAKNVNRMKVYEGGNDLHQIQPTDRHQSNILYCLVHGCPIFSVAIEDVFLVEAACGGHPIREGHLHKTNARCTFDSGNCGGIMRVFPKIGVHPKMDGL